MCYDATVIHVDKDLTCWPCGGDVEGSGGDLKFPSHSLHRLPQLPPRILGGLRHRYCHPQGKTDSAVSGLEGGGPVRDLPGPEQGIGCIGQVQVP